MKTPAQATSEENRLNFRKVDIFKIILGLIMFSSFQVDVLGPVLNPTLMLVGIFFYIDFNKNRVRP